MTYPSVMETGAGKVVWRLKERQGKVCMLAARLVTRWKRMMSQYKPGDSVTSFDIVDEMAIDMHQYGTVTVNLLRQERPVTQWWRSWSPWSVVSVWPVQCERAELGCGMVVSQVQEVLVAAIKENTARTTPWVGNKDSPHLLTE